MTREVVRLVRYGGALALLAALSACSTAPETTTAADAAAAATGSDASTSPADDTASQTGPESGTPSSGRSKSRAPRPGEMRTPARSSGPLDRESFPRPRELGPQWSYSVDPGDAEEGYLGNGTPALERDPAEVALASVPMGCPRPHAVPTPSHALEVDYDYRRTKVIALRASFDDAEVAARFFSNRAENIAGCVDRGGGRGLGTLVSVLHRGGPGVVLSDRTPRSDPWTELALLDGNAVVLVAAHARADEPPVTTQTIDRLAEAFRG